MYTKSKNSTLYSVSLYFEYTHYPSSGVFYKICPHNSPLSLTNRSEILIQVGVCPNLDSIKVWARSDNPVALGLWPTNYSEVVCMIICTLFSLNGPTWNLTHFFDEKTSWSKWIGIPFWSLSFSNKFNFMESITYFIEC